MSVQDCTHVTVPYLYEDIAACRQDIEYMRESGIIDEIILQLLNNPAYSLVDSMCIDWNQPQV